MAKKEDRWDAEIAAMIRMLGCETPAEWLALQRLLLRQWDEADRIEAERQGPVLQ